MFIYTKKSHKQQGSVTTIWVEFPSTGLVAITIFNIDFLLFFFFNIENIIFYRTKNGRWGLKVEAFKRHILNNNPIYIYTKFHVPGFILFYMNVHECWKLKIYGFLAISYWNSYSISIKIWSLQFSYETTLISLE